MLNIAGVSHVYAGRTPVRALDGVTLVAHEREFLAIVGPVGCGKTTLLRAVAGLLQPSEGTIVCDGTPVAGPSPRRGFVFQEDAIFPWMTVRENVEFGLLAKGLEPAARRAVGAEFLGLIGLSAFEAAFPKDLSAGMSKMVEVARVLATDPSILLLDEPFGALDAQTRARMQDALGRLCEQRRKTVLLVTHDAEEAIHLADRVVVISPRPGRVKAELPVDLPRPRSLETRFTADFSALKRRIWEVLGLGA